MDRRPQPPPPVLKVADECKGNGPGSLRALRMILIVALFLGGLTKVYGSEIARSDVLEKINVLLSQFNRDLTEIDLMYWPGLLAKFPELEWMTRNASRYELDAVTNIKEPKRSKDGELQWTTLLSRNGILIAAMYGLPPDQYLDFVDKLLNELSKDPYLLNDFEIADLLWPKGELNGLLAANYKNPNVIRILSKGKSVIHERRAKLPKSASRIDLNGMIDRILSGETYQLIKKMRQRYPREYPNNLELPKLNSACFRKVFIGRFL